MRRRLRRGEENAEVNMTPMLDIVFILLIFFIVTATFLREEGVDLAPPPATDQPPDNEPAPVILVQIDDRDAVFVNQRLTDVARVPAAIERLRAEDSRSAVLITPHPDALLKTLTRVWDDARATGAPVSIQPQEVN
ncbi:MAG: ExbD/TolR family protein [Maricaulaceae bacterium]